MTSRRRLRAISWIALFALMMSMFAPVASRAMAAWSGAGSPWDELCTGLGLKNASSQSVARGSEQPADSDGVRMQDECPYCLPSAQPVSLPSQAPSMPPAADRGFARFLFFFISAPHSYSVPDSIRPRAPPRFA